MKKIIRKLLAFAVVLSLTMSGCISSGNSEDNDKNGKNGTEQNTTNNSSDYISSLPQEVQKQMSLICTHTLVGNLRLWSATPNVLG